MVWLGNLAVNLTNPRQQKKLHKTTLLSTNSQQLSYSTPYSPDTVSMFQLEKLLPDTYIYIFHMGGRDPTV